MSCHQGATKMSECRYNRENRRSKKLCAKCEEQEDVVEEDKFHLSLRLIAHTLSLKEGNISNMAVIMMPDEGCKAAHSKCWQRHLEGIAT